MKSHKKPIYRAINFRNNDLTINGTELFQNIVSSNSSPNGWHFDPVDSEYQTVGNNVKVIYNDTLLSSQNGSSFDFYYDNEKDPGESIPASMTNVFYIANIFHVCQFFLKYIMC